jgi:hypothetical protein
MMEATTPTGGAGDCFLETDAVTAVDSTMRLAVIHAQKRLCFSLIWPFARVNSAAGQA